MRKSTWAIVLGGALALGLGGAYALSRGVAPTFSVKLVVLVNTPGVLGAPATVVIGAVPSANMVGPFSIAWSFPGGAPPSFSTTTLESVPVEYTSAGTFSAAAVVTDANGDVATGTVDFTVVVIG